MNCSRNDVVLLPIPFTDLTSRKVRPAIIIGRNGAELQPNGNAFNAKTPRTQRAAELIL
jgi:hypothetical protein